MNRKRGALGILAVTLVNFSPVYYRSGIAGIGDHLFTIRRRRR
jgi:hypothetical protein